MRVYIIWVRMGEWGLLSKWNLLVLGLPCTNFHFVQVRLRLGKSKTKNYVLHFAFTLICTNSHFVQVRLRLG